MCSPFVYSTLAQNERISEGLTQHVHQFLGGPLLRRQWQKARHSLQCHPDAFAKPEPSEVIETPENLFSAPVYTFYKCMCTPQVECIDMHWMSVFDFECYNIQN